DSAPMTAGHFIFIPSVLLIGIVIGWVLGSRAARDAFAAELRRREERAARGSGGSGAPGRRGGQIWNHPTCRPTPSYPNHSTCLACPHFPIRCSANASAERQGIATAAVAPLKPSLHVHSKRADSPPHSEPLREYLRQSRVDDFRLGVVDPISRPEQFDAPLGRVDDRIRGARIAVARLADGARIDQVLASIAQLDLCFSRRRRTDAVERLVRQLEGHRV